MVTYYNSQFYDKLISFIWMLIDFTIVSLLMVKVKIFDFRKAKTLLYLDGDSSYLEQSYIPM
jgi:hypothetical protein